MTFDYIIGNPPYQNNIQRSSNFAPPIYPNFIDSAEQLNPKAITMIIPSRWFNGGVNLGGFRSRMINGKHISKMVNYTNANDIFNNIELMGGVNYFLWERSYSLDCIYTDISIKEKSTVRKKLNEFNIIIPYNRALTIIRKVTKQSSGYMNTIVSTRNFFAKRNCEYKDKQSKFTNDGMLLYTTNGFQSIKPSQINKGSAFVSKYKVICSKIRPGNDYRKGQYKLFSTLKILKPNEICTDSYLVVSAFDNMECAINLAEYMRTKFVRFLIVQADNSINISRGNFAFVPIEDFSESWSDDKLYDKYDLTDDEIEFIDSLILPLEINYQ